jgi:hypothetical protein
MKMPGWPTIKRLSRIFFRPLFSSLDILFKRLLSKLVFKERERRFAEHWSGAYFKYVRHGCTGKPPFAALENEF